VSDDALLPFVDAWSVDIEAPPRVVWEVLLASVPGPRPGAVLRAWAAVWRAEPADSNGLAPHVLGAERPGLAVCEVVPASTYALAGRHRFARYQLVFRIGERHDGRSRLTAETFASFPGTSGRLYRTLLLDAKSHAMVMWITLRLLRRRAQHAARLRESTTT
jgi:hypothetical protein